MAFAGPIWGRGLSSLLCCCPAIAQIKRGKRGGAGYGLLLGRFAASSARREASSGLWATGNAFTGSPPSVMPQVASPMTGRPTRRASAISERVPNPPPTATRASLARTSRTLRPSPSAVGRAMLRYGLPAARSPPGSRPTVWPPAACAPRHTAVMPPHPPHRGATLRRRALRGIRPSRRGGGQAIARRPGRLRGRGRCGGTITRRPGRRRGPLMRGSGRCGGSEVDQELVEEADGAGLVEGMVAVAALGRLDAGGAAGLAGAGPDGVPGRAQVLGGELVAALGDAGAAGVAVVDEDGGHAGVRVPGGRQATDVPAVAHREQG